MSFMYMLHCDEAFANSMEARLQMEGVAWRFDRESVYIDARVPVRLQQWICSDGNTELMLGIERRPGKKLVEIFLTPVEPERPAKDTKAEELAIRLSDSFTAYGATIVDLDADDDDDDCWESDED